MNQSNNKVALFTKKLVEAINSGNTSNTKAIISNFCTISNIEEQFDSLKISLSAPRECCVCKKEGRPVITPPCNSAHTLCTDCIKSSLSESYKERQEFTYFNCSVCNQKIECSYLEDKIGIMEYLTMVQEITDTYERENREKPKFTCQICYDEMEVDEGKTLDCDHRFCEDCLSGHVNTNINSSKVSDEDMVCPLPDCKVPIHVETVRAVVSEEDFDRFCTFRLRLIKSDNDLLKYCPMKGCEGYFFIPKGMEQVQCPLCKLEYCPQCNDGPHPNMNCQEFAEKKKREQQEEENDVAFKNLAKDQKWHPCPKCGVYSELKTGCNFLTCPSHECRSRTHFCNLCGIELTSKQHYSHYKVKGPFGDVCNTMDGSKED